MSSEFIVELLIPNDDKDEIMGYKESPIRTKSFSFACEVVHYCDVLKENRDYELASQLLKSATSIGANTTEAQRGVSTKDFKNKFGMLSRKQMKRCIG